ncbi:ribosomal protein S7 [Coleophoma crateriformis]|uniref:Small ribosomal subunit protein uS7m n=1 Tax=Coleophoma crateriformis TaxID=565419 RepID=A0A3D8T743_9HELO|nr:ribosomal protein S7 [Coleophoma crateriformis]
MSPRLNLFRASRSLAIRSKSSVSPYQPRIFQTTARRGFADEKATGPNQDVLGHVSEEAADMGDITGETKPDLGQGTPVQEILERDEKGKENAPEVIKKEIQESTEAQALSTEAHALSIEHLVALRQMENIAAGKQASHEVTHGHKFGVPDLPIPSMSNLHYRYDTVVDQVTNLIMEHGKLSKAQRDMSFILNHLRTAPPPQVNPARPLLPGTPPPSHLPLNPVLYLTAAIDSVAPLLRIRSMKGAAGGGTALQLPAPLGLRQRRRTAIKWILDSASKKRSRGSGRGQFAQRVAEEIVSVVEGRSAVWDRRQLIHKTGTSARANLNVMAAKMRRR